MKFLALIGIGSVEEGEREREKKLRRSPPARRQLVVRLILTKRKSFTYSFSLFSNITSPDVVK